MFRRLGLFELMYVLNVLYSTTLTDSDYQLPKNVKPIRYNLTMKPKFCNDTFSGTVSIEILALKSSRYITLHAVDLSMPCKKRIIVQELKTRKVLAIKSAKYLDSIYQYYKISLYETLIKDTTYVLTIPKFRSKFGTHRYGFSSGKYTENGTDHYFAYTNFEPTDARRAFPCFDEPALRAKFNIRLVRPSQKFISASNGRLISQSNSSPFIDTYEETVDMPTYLVAFTITEMKFSETLDRYRIIARPEALNENHHKYGLNLTVSAFNFMETYTRVPFILPKIDEVAIPEFQNGGMENWGLIVYNENCLLLSSEDYKEDISNVVAHEAAHQWFGNLIGFTWWKYIWLSEGMTTYFQYLILDQVETNIDSKDKFLTNMQNVFQLDTRFDTRPLTQNAETPEDISLLFDNIAYEKGGVIIHMLETSLTTTVFQRGLQYYVENMKYKLATPADLYQNLQKAVDENRNIMQNLTVADFMYYWENFKGFPVVDVDRTYGSNSNIVKLKQTRYTADPVGEDGHWIIPINFASSNKLSFENTNPEYWMTKTQQTVTLLYLNDSNWLIANKKCSGYYRVNYDETNWDLITQALLENHLNIHVLNRAQLIDDSLNLAITGRLKMDITMKLVPYINNETDPIPWISYLRNMRKLQTLVYYSQNYNIFKEYNFNITKSVLRSTDFEKQVHEPNLHKDLRNIVLNLLCQIDHPKCINKSFNKLRQSSFDNKKSLSELDSYALCGAIKVGSQQDFDYLYHILKQTSSPINIIKGLSCTKNIRNLYKLLRLNDKIPLDEIIETVMHSGPEGLHAVINFIAHNFTRIETRLERRTFFLLRKVSDLISTNYHLNKLKQAISNSKHAKLFSKVLAVSKKNIAWRKNAKKMFIEV